MINDKRGVAVAELLEHEGGRDALRLLHHAANLNLAIKRMNDFSPRKGLSPKEEPVVGEEPVGRGRCANWRWQCRPGHWGAGTVELVVVPEFVAEREDSEMLVGPAYEATVYTVQVTMNDQASVKRQHPRADSTNLLATDSSSGGYSF